jgi:hypothetical protein
VVGIVIVEGVAIVLLALLVAGLLRSHAEILQRLHQLGAGILPDATADGLRGVSAPARPSGATAHDVTGVTLSDETAAIAVRSPDRDTVLAFLSSGCETCARFWTAFGEPSLGVPGGARLVVVAREADQESPARLSELAPAELPLVLSSQAWEEYQVPGAPYFVYVHGPTGRVVGEGTGGSWTQVAGLLGQALADARSTGDGADAGDGGDPVERELFSAGIGPHHPSLYGPPEQPRKAP